VRLLTNADVASVLDMRGGIAALRTGYDDLARGDAAYIPRIDLYAPTGREDDYYQWGSMAGACRSYGVVAVRIKSDVTSWPEGRTSEKHCMEPGTYAGIILLYSITNGEPLALLQDGYLQHVRVGAAAGIGADLMARPDADTLGLIGSGGMARTYLEAIAEVRSLREVRVYSTTAANRERFAAAAREELGLEVHAVASAQEAVTGAGIVATATDSMTPTFDPGWLSAGTHVTVVTRRELSPELVCVRTAARARAHPLEQGPRDRRLPDADRRPPRPGPGPDVRRPDHPVRHHRHAGPAVRRRRRPRVAAGARARPRHALSHRVVPAGHP
jgi:alanine dehydrogenase